MKTRNLNEVNNESFSALMLAFMQPHFNDTTKYFVKLLMSYNLYLGINQINLINNFHIIQIKLI